VNQLVRDASLHQFPDRSEEDCFGLGRKRSNLKRRECKRKPALEPVCRWLLQLRPYFFVTVFVAFRFALKLTPSLDAFTYRAVTDLFSCFAIPLAGVPAFTICRMVLTS
jgi:hypothetical protein